MVYMPVLAVIKKTFHFSHKSVAFLNEKA